MGCVLNRGTRHEPAWYVKYRDLDGRWRMVASRQPTKEQARRFVEQVEARIAAGKVGIAEPTPADVDRQRLTLADLLDRFTRDYSDPRVKDLWATCSRGTLSQRWASGAAEVMRADLRHLRYEKLTAGLSKATVKLVLAYLSRAYNWAREEGIVECANPVALVEMPSVAGQDRDYDFLLRDEAECLLDCALANQPAEHPFYATAVYTGMRLGELCGLRWADVDLDRGVIAVRRSYRGTPKSGKSRHVPVNKRLGSILRAWRNRCSLSEEGLVFPTASGCMRDKDHDYGWKAARDGAGCHPVRFHDLRHTFASHFVMSGGNILTLQKILGHSSVNVTMKYAHLAPDFMAEEVGRMSFERPQAGVASLAEKRAAPPAHIAG